WAKPLSFDWPFVASHFEQLGGRMPFHYRIARDLNSFIAGLRGIPEHTSMEEIVPNNGDKHNALHDCAFQIDCLMHAKRGDFQQVISV
ncbi:MAG: 3'-5' exoribonuclease domain-containing protein, partial [Sphingomonas sp.]|uniref:3'-5' exoribonuclease domain-containing protein n=1 Tax=Sphingomonas sp. TaxID=28214 RepID=UPI003F81E3A0